MAEAIYRSYRKDQFKEQEKDKEERTQENKLKLSDGQLNIRNANAIHMWIDLPQKKKKQNKNGTLLFMCFATDSVKFIM